MTRADTLIALAERVETKGESHGCPDCGLYSCVCFDDEEYQPEEDDGWDECGMMPDGYCALAGTEWCDWDCPRTRASSAALRAIAAGEGE